MEAVGLEFVLSACKPSALADISDVVSNVMEKITPHGKRDKAASSKSKTQYSLECSYAVLASAAPGVQVSESVGQWVSSTTANLHSSAGLSIRTIATSTISHHSYTPLVGHDARVDPR